jgi:hypothetical protein
MSNSNENRTMPADDRLEWVRPAVRRLETDEAQMQNSNFGPEDGMDKS